MCSFAIDATKMVLNEQIKQLKKRGIEDGY